MLPLKNITVGRRVKLACRPFKGRGTILSCSVLKQNEVPGHSKRALDAAVTHAKHQPRYKANIIVRFDNGALTNGSQFQYTLVRRKHVAR